MTAEKIPAHVVAASARARKPHRGPRPVEPGDQPDWRSALIYKPTGAIDNCTANAITILTHDDAWSGVLAFDELRQCVITTRAPAWDAIDAPTVAAAGEWSDTDTTRLAAWLMRRYTLKLGRESVLEAIAVVADRRRVHGVRDWLDGLTHDGVPRVDTWLATYLGAQATPYAASVGRWFLVSAVARIYQPGVKVDTLIVLEGAQGAGKSTAARVLFTDAWFSDTPVDLDSKDRFLALRGRWALEFAELDSLGRADANRIKGFLSSTADDFRPPYGRGLVHVPRSCVFVGTTNHDDYLRDETGGRRFWPVRCGRIDLEALERDREQLWAEAVALYRAGASWWPDADAARLCAEEQAERLQRDVWADAIDAWLARQPRDAAVTVAEVLSDAIGVEKARQGQADANRVARVLRSCGWERRRVGGRSDRRWAYVRVPVAGESGPQAGAPGAA